MGGMIGVFTIVFNNMAFGKISVSAILALGLLGQSITSIFADHFGIFKMPKIKFNKRKIIGVAFLIAGIFVMITIQEANQTVAILAAFLTGLAVVFSRTLNARLAQETNIITSTLLNYVIGLVTSLFFLATAGKGESILASFALPSDWWIYTGGVIGVFTIMLLNITVSKISSFYLTLLLFVGQVFAGIIIDIVLSGTFSVSNLIGGILVAIGLSLNILFDKLAEKENLTVIKVTS